MHELARRHQRLSLAVGAALVIVVAILAALLTRPGANDPALVITAGPTAPPTGSPPTPSARPSLAAAPSPVPSLTATSLPSGIADLTGEHVDDTLAHRLPIAVLIDDNRVARPQSGFNGASVVYQAPADGGETRYMMVFQEGDSKDVGPVRSGRLFFIHWASEMRAGIAHYGGDVVTREYLASHDRELFTDIDALRTTATPFHRISSRRPPHNAYTSTAALRRALGALHAPATMPPELIRHSFVDPGPMANRPARQTIRIPYATVHVSYVFDRSMDRYVRQLAGRVQKDPADRLPVTTRNVVILFMTYRLDPSVEPGHNRPIIGDVGRGEALVFHDGRMVDGTWVKESETASTRVVDAAGADIPLVRGRTFVQIVPIGTKVVVGD